eukprot:1694000-Rhodomonas_salina.1
MRCPVLNSRRALPGLGKACKKACEGRQACRGYTYNPSKHSLLFVARLQPSQGTGSVRTVNVQTVNRSREKTVKRVRYTNVRRNKGADSYAPGHAPRSIAVSRSIAVCSYGRCRYWGQVLSHPHVQSLSIQDAQRDLGLYVTDLKVLLRATPFEKKKMRRTANVR